ncbi:MAG: PorT family protein, partial [Spirosomaceae bacterium]|nr:PorT family protein [Spirosomataceae bacterium]
MKKQLYLTCTAALFFINAPAQQLNLGAVAGTNYSFDNHVAEKFHLGYSVGAFMEVAFNRHIFARGEITYLSKQRSNLQQSVGYNKFAPYTVNAWQIPLTLGYRVKWKALQPYLQAGMFVHSAQN